MRARCSVKAILAIYPTLSQSTTTALFLKAFKCNNIGVLCRKLNEKVRQHYGDGANHGREPVILLIIFYCPLIPIKKWTAALFKF